MSVIFADSLVGGVEFKGGVLLLTSAAEFVSLLDFVGWKKNVIVRWFKECGWIGELTSSEGGIQLSFGTIRVGEFGLLLSGLRAISSGGGDSSGGLCVTLVGLGEGCTVR